MTTHTQPEPKSVQISTSTEGITTITLNRPYRRNAVDGPTAQKLTDAFLSFEADQSQKVCVLHGTGGTFCAGFDLHEVAKYESQTQPHSQKEDDSSSTSSSTYNGPRIATHERVQGRNMGPIGPSRMIIPKPVIAAVSGFAVAGGLELSLIADIRVAEEDAIFGVFCRRWGVPLIDGGTVRLQAIIGLGRALDMILTGRAVGAEEALSMGLANRVVGKGKALDEAMRIARQLVRFPQGCMNVDRASCYHAAFEAGSFEGALGFEYDHGVEVIEQESLKGAARFSAGAGRHGRFDCEGNI
ncbi:enoyl-CoA hydratase/isomerase family protein [Aspergillus undulatus]|uniref:enoyl-CoA hydratase/isomerase family protein n=1 Tax=Aspergillus undulatus TaxID=1810928 RepID=UPI003CCD07B7